MQRFSSPRTASFEVGPIGARSFSGTAKQVKADSWSHFEMAVLARELFQEKKHEA
jgi:hypothetical protein